MTELINEPTNLRFPDMPGLKLTEVTRPSHTPLGEKIGLHYLVMGEDRIGTGLAYAEHLAGNSYSGVLHGGVVTAMIDETAGGAVVLTTNAVQSLATMDLRIDYMRPAEPGRPLYCLAHCFKTTRRIAFFRAEAFHEPDQPVAVGTGTFMLGANKTVPGLLGNLPGLQNGNPEGGQ